MFSKYIHVKTILSDKKIYQKLGYSIDQEGILTRFLREGEAWKLHLENTKQWIRNAYATKNYESIAIFGSGWLLDIPIDDIIQDFSQIYLFDIIHPLQITHKYRKFSHVHFIEADITGGVAKKVYERMHTKSIIPKKPLHQIAHSHFTYNQSFDFVVSLNILNQLDTLLIEALENHETISGDEKQEFRYIIQQNHINTLTKQAYCLISDWEKIVTHKPTEQKHTEPIVFVNPPPHKFSSEWMWDFDSHGLYESNCNIQFKVKAFCS